MKFHCVPCLKQQGFSLIEILIAIIVLSIGLLGLAGLQLSSLRNSNSAYARSQAVVLTNDIIDRMRANIVGFNQGRYDDQQVGCQDKYNCTKGNLGDLYVSAEPTANCRDVACSTDEMVATDLYAWQTRLNQELPNAVGRVFCTPNVTGGGVDQSELRARAKYPNLVCGTNGQYLITVTWVEVDRDIANIGGGGAQQGTRQHTVATGFRP